MGLFRGCRGGCVGGVFAFTGACPGACGGAAGPVPCWGGAPPKSMRLALGSGKFIVQRQRGRGLEDTRMPAPGVGVRSQSGAEVKVRSRCQDEKLEV